MPDLNYEHRLKEALERLRSQNIKETRARTKEAVDKLINYIQQYPKTDSPEFLITACETTTDLLKQQHPTRPASHLGFIPGLFATPLNQYDVVLKKMPGGPNDSLFYKGAMLTALGVCAITVTTLSSMIPLLSLLPLVPLVFSILQYAAAATFFTGVAVASFSQVHLGLSRKMYDIADGVKQDERELLPPIITASPSLM